ncbi:unnamed protein product [Toxocara canis]|uniref:Lectin_legB domain-containing protein n=1 Tax=Toxocara canis TaxID=6265 RepID=A0A183U6H9_TOXCA|nr:unnamed protein product [Toxocara canis]
MNGLHMEQQHTWILKNSLNSEVVKCLPNWTIYCAIAVLPSASRSSRMQNDNTGFRGDGIAFAVAALYYSSAEAPNADIRYTYGEIV